MASAEQHSELYGVLRAELLARFFAYGRYFRTNHLSLANILGLVHQGDSGPPHADSINVTCEHRREVRPDTFQDSTDLLNKGAQLLERWRVANHGRENPLLYGSQLLVALTVEHLIGRQDALPIIQLAIETIGSLYKFRGNHMDGYILRWDPVTSDKWATEERNGRAQPLYCCEFIVDVDGNYLYCTPFDHPAYVRFNPNAHPDQEASSNDDDPDRVHAVELYRSWEVSMDELVGLVLSYDFVYNNLKDDNTLSPRVQTQISDLRTEIRRQVANLGDYLAEHGYLLVRPCGGFTARGASGVLPAMEFPFGRVFERITGNAFSSRASFEQALRLAGVWSCMEPKVRKWTAILTALAPIPSTLVGAPVGALVFGLVVGLFGGFPIPLSILSTILVTIMAMTTLFITVAAFLGPIAATYFERDCFDVSKDAARSEFAGAHFLKLLPAKQRFTLWMSMMSRSLGGFARNFPQFLGLTAIEDSDTTVKNAFLSFLNQARTLTNSRGELLDEKGVRGNTGFGTAVAVALGSDSDEPLLRQWLDEAYDNFDKELKRNLKLREENCIMLIIDPDDPEKMKCLKYEHTVEGLRQGAPWGPESPMGGLEYLACLALNWYQVQKKGRVSRDLFALPDPADWPAPTIPLIVFNEELIPALQGYGGGGQPSTHMPRPPELFPASAEEEIPPESHKSAVPAPILPTPTTTNEYTIIVRESDGEINTQIPIYLHDRVTISASGEIWAGVRGTGNNGPGGWNNIDHNKKFPLLNSHPFCLLYKLVPLDKSPTSIDWIRLGNHHGRPPTTEYKLLGPEGTRILYFRINDDKPGNGSGYFTCSIKIERPPH